jgi:hypothetical protein
MSKRDIQLIDIRGIEHGTRCIHVAVGGELYRYLLETDEPVPGTPAEPLPNGFAIRALRYEDGVVPATTSWTDLDPRLDDEVVVCLVTDPAFTSSDPCPTLSAICRDRGGAVYDHTDEVQAP